MADKPKTGVQVQREMEKYRGPQKVANNRIVAKPSTQTKPKQTSKMRGR
jgi:hypothetical protein